MQPSSPVARLKESEINELISFVRIAELHGSYLSLSEALDLTSSKFSEEELKSQWEIAGDLASEYPLRSGLIVPMTALSKLGLDAIRIKAEAARRRVEMNMRIARAVSKVFSRDGLRMFSVSGGNSYDHARPGDDIDIFCVTKTNQLWRFILKQLLVVRFYRIFRKDIPRLCFSYALDEVDAQREFQSPQDMLFARDALNLKVIEGRAFFDSLVGSARWIEGVFPKAYRASTGPDANRTPVEKGSGWQRALNLLLYRTLGAYLRLKCAIDNAKHARMGKVLLVNRLRIGEGCLLYEPRKYQTLREVYRRERAATMPVQARTTGPGASSRS